MSATTRRSYRPGAWFGVFGDHATVLLPPSEKSRVARIWELLDDGAGFDEVLDELISGGLRELPGFVLISDLGADTKVIVRGAGRASFALGEETVELEGASGTTWVERTLTSVASMCIDVEEVGHGDGDDLSVDNGLVRVSRVRALPRATAGDEPVTPLTRVPPAEIPDLGPATEAMAPPGLPGQPQAPTVLSRPVARLVLPSGENVEVDRAVIVGRAPEGRRLSSTEQPRLVEVDSPQQEVSSTHLEIRPGSGADHGSAVVTDLGSTNGTILVQPGLPAEDLRAGVATQLVPGAVIDLGDGVTIQVINP